MDTVNNIEEAMDWFINNSSGEVKCIKGTEEMVCESYPDAEKFYKGE